MSRGRKGLLAFQGILLLAALCHFLTVVLPGRNPTMFSVPLLLSVGYLFARYRKRFFRSHHALSLFTVSVLITSTIADHLLNVVPFEPNGQVASYYKQLQSLLLLIVPAGVTIYGDRKKADKTMLLFGLSLQLLPPYSYAMVGQFLVPSYGKTVVMLYILMGLPGMRLRIDRSIRFALLLLPLLALPSLFYAHSIGNTIDHIFVLSLLVGSAFLLSTLSDRETERLVILTVLVQSLLILFSIILPGLLAVSSNVTAMGAEWVMLIALCYFFRRGGMEAVLGGMIFISAVVLLMYRIGSTTGLIATVCGVVIFLYMEILHRRLPERLRSWLLPAGLVMIVSAALVFLLLVSDNRSVQIRRLLWNMALSGVGESLSKLFMGTGDFGPYHFFLFRHLHRPLTSQEGLLLRADPWLIGHHPHSDAVLALYGGGLAFVAVMAYLMLRTLFSSLRTDTPRSGMAAGLMGTILLHGLTEPFATSPVTTFIFLSAIILYWKQLRVAPMRVSRTLSVPVFAVIVFFVSIAAWQVPVVRFWKHNSGSLLALQSGHDLPPVSQEQLEEARIVLAKVEMLSTIQPWESDIFRQEGDLSTIIGAATGDQQALKNGFSGYCKAFRLRSSPVHFQSLKRSDGLTNDHRQCQGMNMVDLEKSFDPYDLTHFIQTVPGEEP